MQSLKDKVVLVTGSSRGIGAAMARTFAREGARVAVHGRDRAALASVRGEIESAGGHAIDVVADVTQWSEIEAMRARIEAELGAVDVLVANAGGNTTRPGLPFEEITEEAWHTSIDGNLSATILTIKSVLPAMRARRSGVILTISSAAGRRAHARSPLPYAVAKAGIQMLTQQLATQVGPDGIRVNCIAPETILTERTERQIPADVQATMIDAHPLKRLGTTDDVARAAVYLASDEASWITGVIFDVAGGAVMR